MAAGGVGSAADLGAEKRSAVVVKEGSGFGGGVVGAGGSGRGGAGGSGAVADLEDASSALAVADAAEADVLKKVRAGVPAVPVQEEMDSKLKPLHVGLESGASGSKGRKMDEIVEYYTDSESEMDGELEYESDDSVDESNVKSFKEKVRVKLEKGMGYINVVTNNGRYRCPYHHNKSPSGLFGNLLEHAKEKACKGDSKKDKAMHEVLVEYLSQYK